MRYEAFPEIEVPPFLQVGRWKDHSYRNDACAKSFLVLESDAHGPTRGIIVWVNYDDPSDREVPHKYRVEARESAADWEDDDGVELYSGENAAEAVAVIVKYMMKLEVED